MRAFLAIAALVCLLASARAATVTTEAKAAQFEPPIDVHVVYVMTFSVENRPLNDGQSIKISAATLSHEINSILHDGQPGHEIIALLLASSDKHTVTTTDFPVDPAKFEGVEPDTYVDIPTYIFTFSSERAKQLSRYAIVVPPPPEKATIKPPKGGFVLKKKDSPPPGQENLPGDVQGEFEQVPNLYQTA